MDTATKLVTFPPDPVIGRAPSDFTDRRFVVDDSLDFGVQDDDKLLRDWNVTLLP